MGYLVDTPERFILHANLIIGASGTPLGSSLPVNFAGPTLWRTRLRDGRIAVLVGRLLPLDDLNRERIRYFREELGVHATFSTMPKTKYIELHDTHWSPEGGNVILVVPMGEEAFRSEQEVQNTDQLSSGLRPFVFRSPRSAADLIAPDGNRVAVVETAEVAEEVELTKGLPKRVELGSLSMQIEPDNLFAGSTIKALEPRRLVCIPNVGGGSPRSWEYIIHSRFDGSQLTAVIDRQSVALQNKNPAQPVDGLGEGEEIMMVAPAETLELIATLDQPSASKKLVWRFTLRDRR